MSLLTKTLHRKAYPAIDASSPEQSQAGRTVLIIGGTGAIGSGAAQAFITAKADTVVITSRDASKATSMAEELEVECQARTKVRGYQVQTRDMESVASLWDALARDGISVDVLILNATELALAAPRDDTLLSMWEYFEFSVRNHLVSVDRFRAQGAKQGKVLLYVSTNAFLFPKMPLHYITGRAPRVAMTHIMSDLAINTPVDEVQILSIHPGFVLTGGPRSHGHSEESLHPLQADDASLPANFYVWASTKKAAFLHGRYVWTNWDVDELMALAPRIEEDDGFLKVGVQGLQTLSPEMLADGMGRSV